MSEIFKANSLDDIISGNFEKVEEAPVETTQTQEAPVETVTETITENKPVVETTTETVVEPQIQIQEKIVEKIVEKYPEMDENAQQILAALQEGKEDVIYNYLQDKFKNYDVMSDFDVIKEKLRKEYPHYTEKNIEAKFKADYGRSFELIDLSDLDKVNDREEYEEAVKHNQAVEERLDLLEVSATDARKWLNEQKKNIVLPKITTEQPAQTVNEPTQEEIDAFNRQWEAHVEAELPKLSEIKFKVGDEEVTYKVTDEEKAEQTAYMKNFTGGSLAQEFGWVDKDGKENVVKIAEDRLKLKNFDKIIASAITQAKTATKKEVIAKDIKNIDTEQQSTANVKVVKSWADTVLDA